jgi:hypothetical protein
MHDKTLAMPEFKPNVARKEVLDIMKKTTFLDIETSLVEAYTFRTGKQAINIDQLKEGSQTKLLTVAGGSWYDLYHYEDAAMWGYGNHERKTAFKKDPLDDTYVLKKLWHILDKSSIIVAHNASFDAGWIMGRFLQKGWRLPSKFFTYCTFRSLHKFRMNSKKLDYLSQTLIGTEKVKHSGMDLWIRCQNGDVDAFNEMLEYNYGDIYNTLYQVFMRTTQYNPEKCIDLSGDGMFCKVDGSPLVKTKDLYTNRSTGLEYLVYTNERLGLFYRDRYNVNSKKADLGYITPLINTGAL